MSFFPLDRDIFTSTLWVQGSMEARLLWMYLLPNANVRTGIVTETIPAIALLARIPLEKVTEALEWLASPDPYSRSPENDGRRIEFLEVDGRRVIKILNYEAYQNKDYSTPRTRSFYERHPEKRRERAGTKKAEREPFPDERERPGTTDTDTDTKTRERESAREAEPDPDPESKEKPEPPELHPDPWMRVVSLWVDAGREVTGGDVVVDMHSHRRAAEALLRLAGGHLDALAAPMRAYWQAPRKNGKRPAMRWLVEDYDQYVHANGSGGETSVSTEDDYYDTFNAPEVKLREAEILAESCEKKAHAAWESGEAEAEDEYKAKAAEYRKQEAEYRKQITERDERIRIAEIAEGKRKHG